MSAEEQEHEIYKATIRAQRQIVEVLRDLETISGRRVRNLTLSEIDVSQLGCPYKETIRSVDIDLERPVSHRRWARL